MIVKEDVLKLKERASPKTAKHETPLSGVTAKPIFSILGEWSGTRNTERNGRGKTQRIHIASLLLSW